MSITFNINGKFFTPMVTRTYKGKTLRVTNDDVKQGAKGKGLPLNIAYIGQALCNQSFDDVTVINAVSEIGKVLMSDAIPSDLVYSVYLPASPEKRESDDIADWVNVFDMTQAEVKTACETTFKVAETILPARKALKEAEEKVASLCTSIPTIAHTQVTWKEGSTRGKGAGGSKAVESVSWTF